MQNNNVLNKHFLYSNSNTLKQLHTSLFYYNYYQNVKQINNKKIIENVSHFLFSNHQRFRHYYFNAPPFWNK